MKKSVNCNLEVSSEINGKKEKIVVSGRGYYVEENDGVVISFCDQNNIYKVYYKDERVEISFNDSFYTFIKGKEGEAQIKNGDYFFKVTTNTSIIETSNNYLLIEYELKQKDVFGYYKMKLSFK